MTKWSGEDYERKRSTEEDGEGLEMKVISEREREREGGAMKEQGTFSYKSSPYWSSSVEATWLNGKA